MPRTQKKRPTGAKNLRFQKHDPIYTNFSSPLVELINQRLMKNGKKKSSYRLLQKSFQQIQSQTEQDPLVIVEKALRNTTPSVEIQSRRIRGAVYPIPIELSLERGNSRAIRWILQAAKKRSGKTLAMNLSYEFIDASKKIGNAFHKKEEVQKIADAHARRSPSKTKKKK